MGFLQIVEYETDRPDDIDALMRASSADATSAPGFTRLAYTRDRDKPSRYMVVVEFASYSDAMANSARPETGQMANQLAALCTSGPRFHNLDVLESMP